MSHALVQIRDLHVEFGQRPILRGVNASLQQGRVTAVIGLNGSGKTTLLRAVLGEVAYRGKIDFLCGHDHVTGPPRRIGYVPQRLQIHANLPLTVGNLLAMAFQRWPIFLGVSRATRQRMNEVMDRVALKRDLLGQLVEQLSGGELQRVLLGLALAPEPELLLLDEPAAGVDPENEQRIYRLVEEASKKFGVTVLVVSHDLHLVSKHVQHVLCLRDGLVHSAGQPEEVMTPEVLAAVFGSDKVVLAHHHHHGPPSSR